MILKSGVRNTINSVLEEYDIVERGLAEELLDRLVQEFGDELYDDDEESGSTFLGEE